MFNRINVKLLGVVAAVVLLGFGGIFTYLVQNTYEQGKLDLTVQLKTESLVFSDSFVFPLSIENYEEMPRLFDSLRLDPKIRAIYIFDAKNKLVATDSTDPYVEEMVNFTENYDIKFVGNNVYVSRSLGDFGDKFGTFHCVVSAQEKFAMIESSLIGVGIITLLIMAGVFALLLIMLRRIITDPIDKLSKTLQEITENKDWELRTIHDRNDEIGRLQLGFNEMVGVVQRNESQRDRAYKELDKLRDLMKNILDSISSMVIAVDSEFKVTHWNRAAERAFEVQSSTAIGVSLDQLIPQLMQIDEIRRAVHVQEAYRIRKTTLPINDNLISIELSVFPMAEDGMNGAVIGIDDVTEKSKLEELMVQSEKMLSVGGLAAGMAHEINNPLAGIVQNLQVLQNRIIFDLPKNKLAAEKAGITLDGLKAYFEIRDLYTMMDNVLESSARAAKIVGNILSFSKKSPAAAEEANIAELLDKTIELAANDYNLKKHYDFRSIEIKREYEENLPLLRCNPATIQQVFLNIIKNAAEAMMGPESTQHPLLTLSVSQNDHSLIVKIKDSGPGMPEEVRRRIFEPFYTTKESDKGTGLGLSISFFIITENHGGAMSVETALGLGTEFVIELPISGKLGI